MESWSGRDSESEDDNDIVFSVHSSTVDLSQITTSTSVDDVGQLIQRLRAEGFDGYDQKKDLLVVNHDQGEDRSPFQAGEHKIQALRYLKGMLIVAQNMSEPNVLLDEENKQEEIKKQSVKIFQKYTTRVPISAKAVHQMAEEFAMLLKNQLKIDEEKARKQVTMARDLGILLEHHPGIVTITKDGDQVTREYSRNIKISEQYYEDNFYHNFDHSPIQNQPWFKNAKSHAGLSDMGDDTWLDNFFTNKDVFAQLKKYGVPAPPSARWLPLPGNVQDVVIQTATLGNDDQIDPETFVETQFMRMGTTSAFDIKDVDEQKRLAVEMLVEVMRERIRAGLDQYIEMYGDLAKDKDDNIKYFVNYQTLLSPHYFEAYFYPLHKDNNAAFVEMAKEAMIEASSQLKDEFKEQNVQLAFYQTNSAINKLAGFKTIKEFPEDKIARNDKLDAVAVLVERVIELSKDNQASSNLAGYINGSAPVPGVVQLDKDLNDFKSKLKNITINKDGTKLTPKARNEIMMRVNAAAHLRLLMDNKPPYKNLPTYQANLMQASLELLTQGSQGIKLVGCKSARDRTAILAAAVKTMQENPRAMDNWEILNKGIIASLQQGHHFRAMSYHVAMVKVSDVHTYFVKQLDKGTQKRIKETKPLSKTLESIKTDEIAAAKEHPPGSPSTTGIMKELEKQEQIAIVNIKNFQEMITRIKDDEWRVRIGGQRVSYHSTRNQTKTKAHVPTNVNDMLKEIEKANNREQTFREAWQNIAKISVTAKHSSSFFRSGDTQKFYRTTLENLGIDPVESLKKIREVIDETKWHVRGIKYFTGDKPRHVQQIYDEIKKAINDEGKLKNEKVNPYSVLSRVIAIATKTASPDELEDNALRHKETQQFYQNITQYLVPKNQSQVRPVQSFQKT